jgi:hypothetical protein
VPVDFLVLACATLRRLHRAEQPPKALNLPRLSNAMKINSVSGASYRTLYTHASFIALNILLIGLLGTLIRRNWLLKTIEECQ